MKRYAIPFIMVVALFAGCTKTEEAGEEKIDKDEVIFVQEELYPEGLAWHPEHERFYVTSLHYGTIGRVDWKGGYMEYIAADDMPSTIGIELDHERNRLLVCVSDPGVSVHTVEENQRKTAMLAVYDLETKERMYMVNLGALSEGGYHFANDIALDPDGNAYVTDSFSPYIYKVAPDGVATIYATDERWIGEGFNLNGIVYHPEGFLIAANANDGKLYKVDMTGPVTVSEIASQHSFQHADGLTLLDESTLAVVQNQQMEISRVVTADGWKSANKDRTVISEYTFPTTMTRVDEDLYVLNAKLNEIFDPEIENSSEFMIQRLKFE